MKIKNKFINDGQGVGVKGITRDYINKIQIPLPSIENQKLIIKEIKDELEIIEKNKLLISKSEEKINKKLNSIFFYVLPEAPKPVSPRTESSSSFVVTTIG